METIFHEDKEFKNIDYSEKDLRNRKFINCNFLNCNFTKSDLSNNDFTDCSFSDCNFSMAKLSNSGLKNAGFTNCKLIGVSFNECSSFLFSVKFRSCNLDYTSFLKKVMKKTEFIDCSLREADFTEADLTMAVFDKCNLYNAVFFHTLLEKTDFRTAINIILDPERNRIKKARFSAEGALGLLAKYNIEIG